jgi:hypothetical protein
MLDAMRFETKIAVIVRDDLEIWQRLNVTAFLAAGVAANPDLHGEPYADADGTRYLPLFRQPVLVMEGSKEIVAAARGAARRADCGVHRRHVRHAARRGEPGRRRGGPRQRPRPGRGARPRSPQRGDKIMKGATLHR